MPKISVIVPVYNVEQYLNRCVDSILNQTFTDFELILVDDGSPDNCGKICDEYAERDKRIVVIHKENGGLSDARNAGLNIAKGIYISFIDSDDYIDREMIEILYKAVETHEVKIACCGRFDIYNDNKKDGICPSDNFIISSEKMIKKMLIGKECDFSACDKLYEASLWHNFRFPKGMCCEDIFIMSNIVAKAKNIFLCNRKLYYYYHRENSISTNKFNNRSFDYVVTAKKVFQFISYQFTKYSYYAVAFLCGAMRFVIDLYYKSNDGETLYYTQFQNIIINTHKEIFLWLTSDNTGFYKREFGEYDSFKYFIKKFIDSLSLLICVLNSKDKCCTKERRAIIKMYKYILHKRNIIQFSKKEIITYYSVINPMLDRLLKLYRKIKKIL